MNNIAMWIIIGVVCAIVLAIVAYAAIKVLRLDTEERKRLLVVYLEGAVVMAEKKFGDGHGAEKMREVEEYFKVHAGWFLKALLLLTGKDNLSDLIEQALAEVKKNFAK